MKVSFNTNIRTDDWPKAGEDFTQRFISNYSQMVTQLGQALAQGLTFADNMNACWLTASCTHATAVGIANPLQNKSAPKQVLVFPGAQPVRSYSWTYAPSTNQITLTVNYDVTPSFLGPITRVRSNALALSNNVAANVCTTTSITLTPGDWDVRGSVAILGTSSTQVDGFNAAISKTSATLSAADTIAVPTAGELRILNHAGTMNASANDTSISLECYRVSVAIGATMQLFLVTSNAFSVSTLSTYGSLEARLVGPASGTNDTPIVLVIGG